MKSTLLTTLALTPLALMATDKARQTKPNIIMILADDLGYGDVGCYNSESRVPTPNLDRLARRGMRFTDAHSPSTVSTPSRYSLLTGRMAFRIPYKGVFAGVGGPCLIREDQLTLPQMLRDQGYTTAMTGKWHVGLTFFDKEGQRITKGGVEGVQMIDYSRAIPDGPVNRGFDRFFGTACCPATDFLYAYIDGDRIPVPPTGLLDKSNLPKHPYSEDNRDGMIAPDYDLQEIDMVFLKKSLGFLDQHAKTDADKPFFLYHSMNAVHLPSLASKEFRGSTKAGPHGDFIHELDYIVGELMKKLEKLGMAGNTLIVFSSDNGPEVTSVVHMRADYGHDGARPWRGVKRDQWEGGHRVPLIVSWPGKITAGTTCDQTVCLTDIMATCAAITGASLPDNAAEDSYNILPLLMGKSGDSTVRPYTLHQTISLAMAIRKGPWKYLDHRGSGGNNYNNPELKPYALPETAPDAPGQLYNLETDPGETVNLYYQHPEIVREMKALLDGPLGFPAPEYTVRRQKLMDRIPDGIAVIRNSTGNKPNLDFLYLCGVKVPNAVLIVDGKKRESHLFYTTSEDYLKGEGLSPDIATKPVKATGIEFWHKADQFGAVLSARVAEGGIIYTPFTAEEFNTDIATRSEWDGRLSREQQFAAKLREKYAGLEVKDCSQMIWDLRMIKSPAEIAKMRMAGKIGAEAMNAVMKAARPGMYEFELSSLFEYECKRRGCPELAFEVIISSAENHKYLHYSQHNRLLADGDFLVVDAGPAWEDYDTDISISFPVNGTFTPRQKEIYEACKAVSLACLEFYKPGITGYEVGAKVRELLISKGYKVDTDAFSRLRFFKEGGITHSVGLATHDCGGRDVPKDVPLRAGMVFACDVFATFPDENLGVRVENTVLITEKGCENLTAATER